jgi:hypothetical protein
MMISDVEFSGQGVHTVFFNLCLYLLISQASQAWMDTNIYFACLRQVVAFAPMVIIACLRQVVAFAPKVIKMHRLRRRTREGAEVWAEGEGKGGYRFMKLMK